MQIRKGSWSHRAYLWLDRDAKESPTVCEFVNTVYVGGLFLSVLVVILGTILSPLIAGEWLLKNTAWGKNLQARIRAKKEAAKNLPPFCPFGSVKFVAATPLEEKKQ